MDGRQFKDAVFSQFARIGSAFASPRRVEIIDLLAQGERSVDSIAAQTQMSVANTSRHLQILAAAALVTRRRAGLQVFYALADDQVLEGYRGLVALAESRLVEVSALAGAFFGEVDGAKPVSFAQLDELAASGKVIVVDVRPEEEYAAGHIDGAVCVPLVDLSDKMRDLPADVSVVAYCRGPYCVLAATAVAQLREHGFTAHRLAAGYPEWVHEGRPVA